MNVFDELKKKYSIYPDILGYNYLKDVKDAPEIINEINTYDFVFISSDYSQKIPGCTATHVMTSAELPDTNMWLQQEFATRKQLDPSWYTEVPSIGFVGRCPMFDIPNPENESGPTRKALHRGFEPRFMALKGFNESKLVCADFHVRYDPLGDSAGFWNKTLPDYVKNGPMFDNNLLANQYQVCARGNANWSLRFYETLASGRIPLYVESGGKVPINGNIEWLDEVSPFPIVHDGQSFEGVLLKFHENIKSDEDLEEVQTLCREFYMDNFTQEAQIRCFEYIYG